MMSAEKTLAPCGAEFHGIREGYPDCGCGWGQLCSEREALEAMSDREAVAYWNVMQFPGIVVGDDGKRERHIGMLDSLLTSRGIAHERGKRTATA